MSLPASMNTTQQRPSNRMRGSSVTSKFPLPDGAFASSRLSPTQLRVYEQQVHRLIAQALDECERAEVQDRAAYATHWDVVGTDASVTALRRQEATFGDVAPSTTAIKSQYRVIGDVSGDYRDLMEFHYAETSSELFEWFQFMYQSTLDAHVLQTVETATGSNPHHYFGVKWAVFQMSLFATKVDQCFVEYMTYRKDRRGRDIGVRVTLPIRLPEIDLTMDALKVRRVGSQMVQIFRPLDGAKSRMVVMIDNDFPLASPAAYVKTLLTSTRNMPQCIDARRLRRRDLVREHNWVPNSSRRSCVVCTRTFGATRGRHHCRLCGDVMCRKCMVVRDTAEPLSHRTFKVVKTKFCALCVTNLRRTGREPVDLSASAVRTKINEMAFAPTDFEETSSMWSETESESCGRADFGYTDSERSSLASHGDLDSEKHSFGKRLQEIAERIEDHTVLEEGIPALSRSGSTTSRKDKRNDMVLFVPDETTDTSEFFVTIDTKDMIRNKRVDSESSPRSGSGVFEDRLGRPRRGTGGSHSHCSSRSIDQRLAEQEALLRQMVMATQTPQHHHRQDRKYHYE